MTIQRVVQRGERVIDVQNVVPGKKEILSPSRLGSFINYVTSNKRPETVVHVVSDDEIEFINRDVSTTPGENGKVIGKPHTTNLSKHAINDHSIESSPTIFGKRIIYEWIPSITTVSFEQEQAIQELITKAGWSQEETQQVRDRLIYAEQRLRRLDRYSQLRITSRRSNNT